MHSHRLYEPLRGSEASALVERNLSELALEITQHSAFRSILTWPRLKIDIVVKISSLDGVPEQIFERHIPAVTAPDEIRGLLNLPIPVAEIEKAVEGPGTETRQRSKKLKDVKVSQSDPEN